MPLPIAWLAPDSPPRFPPPSRALREPNGLLAAGGDLSAARLLAAYARGIFPWYGSGEPILWWSPDPRCVFASDGLHLSRSLRRLLVRCGWTLSVDRAFADVVAACAAPRAGQPGTWIDVDMALAYTRLHQLGHAHSLEVWQDAELIGGIYGVAVGRAFSGESMFSRRSGGSKVALLALATLLRRMDFPWLDAQVANPHLLSLGAIEMPRDQYLRRLAPLAAEPGTVGAWSGLLPVGEAAGLLALQGSRVKQKAAD